MLWHETYFFILLKPPWCCRLQHFLRLPRWIRCQLAESPSWALGISKYSMQLFGHFPLPNVYRATLQNKSDVLWSATDYALWPTTHNMHFYDLRDTLFFRPNPSKFVLSSTVWATIRLFLPHPSFPPSLPLSPSNPRRKGVGHSFQKLDL